MHAPTALSHPSATFSSAAYGLQAYCPISGLLIQGVGAAWAMTVLTGRPNLVAVVQSAVTLPTTLLSVAAGAVADMYDRRLVGLAALSLSFIAAASLSAVSVAGE